MGEESKLDKLDKRTQERLSHGMRDMVWSLVVLTIIVGAIAWLFGSCQFSPGRPSVDRDAMPSVDVQGELSRMARHSDFALRSPAVPDSWRPTTANSAPVGTGVDATVIARVSWVTDGGHFLRLSQSSAQAAAIVGDEGDSDTAAPEGSERVDGTQWTVYPWRGAEKAWVSAFDDVRIMIAGDGTEQEFRMLAAAVQRAEPLPRG
ncbi:MAG: DUF4245 domain-containing protein [Haloechinothrix sp.]